MKKEVMMAILLLALGSPICAIAAASPQGKSDQKPTFAMVYGHTLDGIEHEVVPAVEACPTTSSTSRQPRVSSRAFAPSRSRPSTLPQ